MLKGELKYDFCIWSPVFDSVIGCSEDSQEFKQLVKLRSLEQV